jgi:hypothetical protein
VGWTVRVVAVVAVLAFVAHARHQTITQMIGGAVNWASQQLDPKDGLLSQLQHGRQTPDITVTPTRGTLPATITVTGTGFQPHEKVEVTAHVTVLSTTMADDHGAFTTTIRVRADEFCPHHQCEVTASGKNSLKWTTAPYDLTD